MILENIKDEIINLSLPGRNFKPHKYIALLTAIEILRENHFRNNRIQFTNHFREIFSEILNRYSSNRDKNRSYTPFFHLKTSSFWKLKPKVGMEEDLKKATSVGGPSALEALVDYAELSNPLFETLQNDNNYAIIEDIICNCIEKGFINRESVESTNENKFFQRVTMQDAKDAFSNPFVRYLNSIQRIGGSNENALAESQSCNPQFKHIHVPHPLIKIIIEELMRPDGKHVILTGHAGDGKSTIAIEVFKRLKSLPMEQPLDTQLKLREDIFDKKISIIKDLSERNKDQDELLLQEMRESDNHFLIVSNTGTLLDLFCDNAGYINQDKVYLENKVLNGISEEKGEGEIIIDDIKIRVFNLSLIDNLHIAREIFERMLSPDRWSECAKSDCRISCPIYKNIELMQSNKQRIIDRIFLAYRRMYEYGTRLTMRQLTEHLAYMVTSGLEKADIAELSQKKEKPLMAGYMFFNRFFGDNGQSEDIPAQQMQAIHKVRQQGFGERPCPTWERRLWLRTQGQQFQIGIKECEEEFELLRSHGSRSGNDNRPGMTSDQARDQVRRMLYFLYDFSNEEKSYINQYLNSPTILQWMTWQDSNAYLEAKSKYDFEQRVYHVLQEHFTGVRLPEGTTQNDRRLYVTLSRRRSEVRQSAQVVLAHVDWSTAIDLKLSSMQNVSGGNRTDLILEGKDRIEGITLKLTLPFLDYVVMRHYGGIGEILQTAYIERLERFKAQIQKKAGSSDERIMLVRLKTDHTFRRQHYSVCNRKLEVSDVL